VTGWAIAALVLATATTTVTEAIASARRAIYSERDTEPHFADTARIARRLRKLYPIAMTSNLSESRLS
jgi:hypothetical protein